MSINSCRVLAATVSLAIAAVAITPLTAQADSAYTITGTAQCTTDGVVGVWVEAANGGSDFATLLEQDVAEHNFYHQPFEFTVPHGGEVTYHVGCGGSPIDWGMSAESGSSSNASPEIVCNSLPFGGEIFQKRIPLFRWMDFTGNGIPFGECQVN